MSIYLKAADSLEKDGLNKLSKLKLSSSLCTLLLTALQ